MLSFYYLLPLMALVILLILFIFIGLMMSKKQDLSTPFPPTSQACPDGWILDNTDPANIKCVLPPFVYTTPGSVPKPPINTGNLVDASNATMLTWRGNNNWKGPIFYSKVPGNANANPPIVAVAETPLTAPFVLHNTSSTSRVTLEPTKLIYFKLNDPFFGDANGSACIKKKWANNLNIVWDGISNYNQC